MKKTFALILTLAMLLCLAACGDENDPDDNDPDNSEASGSDTIEIGDRITFGRYEQDNDTSNGKEDIEWIVLAMDNEGRQALVISEYALDRQPYNTSKTDVTWETCSLRKWLNDTFLNAAFSKEEQAKIAMTNVSADKNPMYSTNPGNETQDKVFLLSTKEARKYRDYEYKHYPEGPVYSVRECLTTKYAHEGRSSFDSCHWWLRSTGGYSQQCAAYVDPLGSVDDAGFPVSMDVLYVRPALWINLDANKFIKKD